MAMGIVYLVILLNYFTRRIESFNLNHIGFKTHQDEPLTAIIEQNKSLHKLPIGNFHVTTLNCAYNNIEEITPFVFYLNFYKNLEKIELQHNQIAKITFDGFGELKRLKSVDISSNNLTQISPVAFKSNVRLEKLDLSNNKLRFDPENPFITSFTVQTLILSDNRIYHVFDISFAKLPQLRNLMLDNNPIYYLSTRSFVQLRHLQYISLANTNVWKLSNTMFKAVPRILDLSNTPLSKQFDPPLNKVKNDGVERLIHIDEYFADKDIKN